MALIKDYRMPIAIPPRRRNIAAGCALNSREEKVMIFRILSLSKNISE